MLVNLIWTDLLIAKSQLEQWWKKLQQSESVSAIPRKDDWLRPKGETQRKWEKRAYFMILHFIQTSKQFPKVTSFPEWSLNLEWEDPRQGLGTCDKSPHFSDFSLLCVRVMGSQSGRGRQLLWAQSSSDILLSGLSPELIESFLPYFCFGQPFSWCNWHAINYPHLKH